MIYFIQKPDESFTQEVPVNVRLSCPDGNDFEGLLDMFIKFLTAIGFSEDWVENMVRYENIAADLCEDCEYRQACLERDGMDEDNENDDTPSDVELIDTAESLNAQESL